MSTMEQLTALTGLVPEDVCANLYIEAREVPADLAIVEIGSFKGKSTCCLAAGARSGKGAHVWAVDPWDLDGNETGRFKFADAETREAFAVQVASMGLSDAITATQGFSAEVGANWTGPPIGLLYIDGDHSYKSVMTDFAAWSPHLVGMGRIIFDDLDTERNPGVRRAVDALQISGLINLDEQRGRLGMATCLV